MKKLMIAAAGAAVGLSAFAVYTPEAYEMNITLKTTTCKAGEGKNICDEGYTTYRVKANQKIAGLIWGCDCPTISEPKAFETFDDFGTENACHGYVFWDASVKTKDPYQTATFDWSDGTYRILQCINPKCTECEGLWTLALSDSEGNQLVNLQGAGFGTACWSSDYLAAYIKSMSGNVTGWAFPGSLSYGCAACGEIYTGCSAWAFCTECEEQGDDVPSIAYGTFTLKFNSSVAKKYAKNTARTSILSAYKFSDAVEAYLVEVDAGYDPEPEEPTAKETAEKAYAKAVEAYDAAKAEWISATNVQAKAQADVDDPKKSASWIAGTNEIVALFKTMETANKTLNAYSKDDNYKATWYACETNATNYVAKAKDYIEKSVELKYYGGDLDATNAVKDAKTAMDNAYIGLENALTAAPGGTTVKTNLSKAVDDYKEAAEAYFDKAVQYVACRDIIDSETGNWYEIDFAYATVKGWKSGTDTVCYADLKKVLVAAQKDTSAKATAVSDAADDMKTKRSICQALGGDCE